MDLLHVLRVRDRMMSVARVVEQMVEGQQCTAAQRGTSVLGKGLRERTRLCFGVSGQARRRNPGADHCASAFVAGLDLRVDRCVEVVGTGTGRCTRSALFDLAVEAGILWEGTAVVVGIGTTKLPLIRRSLSVLSRTFR